MAIRCGHCHESHSTVAEVRACAVISPKARDIEAWIRAQHPGRDIPFTAPADPAYEDSIRAQAHRPINPPRSAYAPGPRAQVTEPGIYRRGASVYQVVRSQAGRLYAKELNREATKRSERWTYAPGAMASLTPDMKLTREQGQEFGRETRICVACGAELTHPVSIERGMGPICYGKWYDED